MIAKVVAEHGIDGARVRDRAFGRRRHGRSHARHLS
ncbi:hypothetical protein FHS25_004147 [Rhizobium laguerreae]|uniref:Uncharacterized protein n=1 Tax=Rhizobium laguerreae TaxID=1076926 RepID=A0ABR6GEA0_9HYPH|nr:hypothetical protein [Rhizobium laguerreae]